MSKILICEDEIDVLESLRNFLQRNGFDVHTASDGEEAILETKSFQPDLILLDLRIPKINGLEVAKQIRKSDEKTKIIIVSAVRCLDIYKEALGCNIYKYITKPVESEYILEVINRALSENSGM